MGSISEVFGGVFADSSALMLAVLVFLATTTATFGVMAAVRVRGAVKRRAAGIAAIAGDVAVEEGGSLKQTSVKTVQRLLDYTTKHFGNGEQGEAKVLRQRLIRAGIFEPRAVGYFFAGRIALAIVLAVAALAFLPMIMDLPSSASWLAVLAAGAVGYVGPSFYIDRRIRSRCDEHRAGFPDFMDLLVVCADSGLSMEASLERVGIELAGTYPSLGANIHMTNLEIRAGRTMTEALEHFGDRLGLEEARSFATLIQQSAELGSSITDALRVYSDDMRHKRLSRAEEKAYSLPAKLSVPMMVCIFPVLFVVILLPVVVRLYTHHY
ncbi:MAG TPA: type II secretion system F family protein [Xanthobacteraceae bacterium]|jgi:tight adherence protein C|nr:type II secretion system F family protein [Xanthobacteraceae bacterium]